MSETKMIKHVLSNGLTVLGEANPDHHSVGVGFFVRTGSRDEEPVESGVSHFLEHMMFKGTERRSALDITFELGNLGAQANAFTSEENTVYYAHVLPEYFEPILELLSDMLRPALDEGEFNTEKNVILEEIALYQDRPHFYLYENAAKDFFGNHPAGNSVLGTTQSISALSRNQMKEYFDRRYAPSNIVLVVSGKFDADSLQDLAQKYCGSWKDLKVERKVTPFKGSAKNVTFRKKDIKQSHGLLLTSSCSAQDAERYPLSILSNIIGDGIGSKIYWELVDPGLAESAGADIDEKDGTGYFSAYASTEPEKLEEVVAKLRSILAKGAEFSDEDLERAKNKIATRIALDGELPMGRLMTLGFDWTYRKRMRPLKEIISDVRSVKRTDIEAALTKFPLGTWAEYRLVGE